MGEKETLGKTKVKHSGVFNFKDMYGLLYDWLISHDYVVEEKTYKESIGAGGTKDIEIEWAAWKKVTDYIKFRIDMGWKAIRMTSVEVEIDGVKQKMNKGDVEIGFSALIEKDYEERWTASPFFRFLRGIYDRYIIRETFNKLGEEVLGDMNGILAETKAFLSLTAKR